MSRARANVSTPLLSSNSLHKIVGENLPTLYPKDFIYFRSSMILMVLQSAWLSAMYSLSVEMMDIYVWSCDFHITEHPKYDTTNTERERSVSESSLASSGNLLPLKSTSVHTLTSLSRGRICMPIFQFSSSSSISSWHPHHVVFLYLCTIVCIGAPRMQCLAEYSFPSS